MTHANFAIKENHPLFVVLPHKSSNTLGLQCAGPQMLADQKGAISIRTSDDYGMLLEKLQAQNLSECRLSLRVK